MRGLFITAEGTDGSGKTTQIKLMEQYLREQDYEVVLTREPGGTNISEKIRELVLDPENTEMDSITEMLLYSAARAQLTAQIIRPAVESGKAVICDRFIDSTFVYQGFGRGIDLKVIENINSAALNGLMPDVTFFFDLSPEKALPRREAATGTDRIEKEKMDFHMRVYNGYKKLALLYPDRIRTIDSSRDIGAIAAEVQLHIDGLIRG